MKHHSILFCLLGVLIANSALATKIYKWVDEQGISHFSEHPPKDVKATLVKPKIGHSEPVTYEVPKSPPSEPTQQSSGKKNPERCEAARSNLQILQNFGRVKVPHPDGSFHYLTEEEQQDKLRATQQIINESC